MADGRNVLAGPYDAREPVGGGARTGRRAAARGGAPPTRAAAESLGRGAQSLWGGRSPYDGREVTRGGAQYPCPRPPSEKNRANFLVPPMSSSRSGQYF